MHNMRIAKGFKLREVCGEHIVMATGVESKNYNKMLHLNQTAAFLWKEIQDMDFTEETLADLLTGNYEVSRETALEDSRKLIAAWEEAKVLE